jgi:DNA-binding beta-propeller fold protein YncE
MGAGGSRMLRLPSLLVPVLVLLAARAAGAGGLFVASQNTTSVLEYSANSGAFERVLADTVSQGFQNPGGIALRPSDGVLHVASQASGEIWRYTTVTGALITPALKTGLYGPRGIAFDATGANLFFADPLDDVAESADTVKKIALPGGALSVVGTSAGAHFCGVAVNGAQVYATDSDGDRVLRFPTAGGSATTLISSGLNEPHGILLPTATQMLIADSGSNRVLEYVLSGPSWVFSRVVLPASSGVQEPCGLALAPDGRLTVTGCVSDDVVLVDLTTLAVTPLVAPGAGGLGEPKDAAWNGSTLLVASANANAVIYYGSSGSPTGVRARGVTTTLDSGIALAPSGQRLLIVSAIENEVVEHDVASGALLRSFGAVCGFLPTDVAYGPDGRGYVACSGDDGVSRIDLGTGQSLGPFVLGGTGGLFAPRSLAFGPDQDLYVSSATGEVLKYDGATGSFLGVFVDSGGNGGGPADPYGLAFHEGKLYVASYFPSEVKAFDAATGAFVSTFVSSGAGGLAGPTALAFGPGGDLFVTSLGNDTIRRYSGSTGAFLSAFVGAGSGGLDGPFDLAFRAAPAVPALSPAGCAMLAIGLAALASRGRRRSG